MPTPGHTLEIVMRNSNRSGSLGLLFSTTTALVSPMHETIVQKPLYGSVPPLTARSTTSSLVHSLLKLFWVWRQRIRQREKLGLLNDRMLQDVGLSRLDVAKELEKPFWQP